MKYEIIKGSEKDFGGLELSIVRVLKSSTGTILYADEKSPIGPHWELIAERRPIAEPVVNQQLTTEWSGAGLPPVDCHCEVKTGKDSWNLCKVVFSDDVAGVAFVYLGGDEENYVGSVDCVGANAARDYFRVMRSPEDVARDEGKEIIAKSLRSSKDYDEAAARILDSIASGRIPGITKTPTVSELMRITENATREDCEAIVKMMGGIK